MKTSYQFHRAGTTARLFALLFLLLSPIMIQRPVMAKEGFDVIVRTLCQINNHPKLAISPITCAACHTTDQPLAPVSNSQFVEGGLIYKTWLRNQGAVTQTAVLNYFCPNVPGAPQNVTARAGDGQAIVNWRASTTNGGPAVQSYTATSSPDDKTCTTDSSQTVCTINGLTTGTAYTFTVTATNSAGVSSASSPSNSVTPKPIDGVCGSATNAPAATQPATDSLCKTGAASEVQLLRYGRYTWQCNGTGPTPNNSKCYTLGNNKLANQPQLVIKPGSSSLKSGQTAILQAVGGVTTISPKYRKAFSSAGTRCTLSTFGQRIKVKATVPSGSGICTIIASKAKNNRYNDVESPSATVAVSK